MIELSLSFPKHSESVKLTVGVLSQASETLVTVPVVPGFKSAAQLAPALTVTFAGTVNVGAVMSLTLIVCEAVEVFPQISVAVHVLVTE